MINMQTTTLLDQINHDLHNRKINPEINPYINLVLNEGNHRIYEPLAPQRLIIHAYLHDDTPLISSPDEQLDYKSILIWDDTTTTTDTYLLDKVHRTLHYHPDMVPYLKQYSSYNVDEIYNDSQLTTKEKLNKIIKDVFKCKNRIEFIKILFNIPNKALIRFKLGSSSTYNGIAILYK